MPSVAIVGTRGYPSYYGGFETAVRKLAPFLCDHDWDVTVYSRPGAVKRDDPTRDPRVRTVTTAGRESKSLSTLSFGLSASVHAARARPDVALIMNVANGYFLPMLKFRGIRTVVNVDGIEWERAKWGRFAKLVFKVGAWMTARFADELIFDSREIERRWREDHKRDGIYIPYGGDELGELPLENGLTHRGYVLAVARFVPENTIPEFLEAAEAISRSIPVVIVGSSGYGGELDSLAARLTDSSPSIHWLGHISDDQRLFSLWQHAAVYFHGHSVGGTNPTLVQALAAGTPIVARDTVYNREVLGNEGYYCAPEAEAIQTAVVALASNQTELKAASDRNKVISRSRYTWDLVNAAYLRALTAQADRAKRKRVS